MLEGAQVSAEWTDDDTMKVTVAGAGTELGVDTFDVSVGVFTTDGNFWDYASGVGTSQRILAEIPKAV